MVRSPLATARMNVACGEYSGKVQVHSGVAAVVGLTPAGSHIIGSSEEVVYRQLRQRWLVVPGVRDQQFWAAWGFGATFASILILATRCLVT